MEFGQAPSRKVRDTWICFGDFNDILTEEEKQRGNDRTSNQLILGRVVTGGLWA